MTPPDGDYTGVGPILPIQTLDEKKAQEPPTEEFAIEMWIPLNDLVKDGVVKK